MGKGSTGAAAGGGAIYGPGIFGALSYYWQQADAFWEYIWAIFPKAMLLNLLVDPALVTRCGSDSGNS